MRKFLMILSVSGVALMFGNNASAQVSQVTADVGSPQGTNTLVIQESYSVTDPAVPAVNNDINSEMQPLPGDPGVEVAPLPEGNQPDNPAPNDNNGYVVDETISTTTEVTQ